MKRYPFRCDARHILTDGDFRTLRIDVEGLANVEKNIGWKERSFRNIRAQVSDFFASYARENSEQP